MTASPSTSTSNAVEHEVVVAAPATGVYQLLSKVAHWPRIFPSTVYVDQVETQGRKERIRIWETVGGEARTRTMHRVFDPYGLRIEFREEEPGPLFASLGGTWIIEPRSGTECRVRLLHDYRVADGDPAGPARAFDEVDRSSRSQLATLGPHLEFAHAATDLAFSFTDTLQINGSTQDVYDFINDAHLWQERLPHVARVRLTEPAPGLQTLEMDTRAKDGSTHTTASCRVTFPHHRIAYKQVTLPALLSLHTGVWTFKANDDGVTASSQHTVVLNTDNITRVLGPSADVAQARDYVRTALSTNSTAMLQHAKEYCEKRR